PVLLATFTDDNPNADISDFSATIYWGDGTTSAASPDDATISIVSVDPGTGATTFGVYGSHQYTEEGIFYVGVKVDDVDGASATLAGTAQGGTAGPQITVADAALTAASGADFSSTEGTSTGNVVVATFSDA